MFRDTQRHLEHDRDFQRCQVFSDLLLPLRFYSYRVPVISEAKACLGRVNLRTKTEEINLFGRLASHDIDYGHAVMRAQAIRALPDPICLQHHFPK